MESILYKEYKKKLGFKIGAYTFPDGKETFGITQFENGFILRKRKNEIVLCRIDLWNLKDLIERFEKKMEVYENLK